MKRYATRSVGGDAPDGSADGSPVAQQVLRYEYAAVTCGPLVYSTALIDGFKFDETLAEPYYILVLYVIINHSVEH